MTKVTSGVYKTHVDAEAAIKELTASGIANSEISCIYTDKEGDMKDANTNSKMGVAAAGGATTGAIIGGIAGLVVANGLLPGLGTLIVAGPLAAALGLTGMAATTVAAAATGAAAGGLIGGLVKLGVDDKDAQLYEVLVKKGDILVIARTDSGSSMEIFTRTNAMEIREYDLEK